MTKQTEALKMAIDVFERHGFDGGSRFDEAFQACKEALGTEQVREDDAQPAQEPVGYISTIPVITPQAIRADKNDTFKIPLYTHPAPPCQECKNLKHDLEGYMEANKALINREWVGLSEEEINALKLLGVSEPIILAIEQALRNKNAL